MRPLVLSLTLAATACVAPVPVMPKMPDLSAPVPMRVTPDDDFRAHAPGLLDDSAFVGPAITRFELSNGIRVLLVERHDVPAVSLRVVSDRGADQGESGIGQLWSRTVLRGSKLRSSAEVRDAVEGLGGRMFANLAFDSSQVHVEVISKLLLPAVALVGELVTSPRFDAVPLANARNKLLGETRASLATPGGQLDMTVPQTLYPLGHLYHWPWGLPENLARIEPPHIESFHRYAFSPGHVSIVVAGDTTTVQLRPALEQAFGTLTGPVTGPQAPPPAPADGLPDARFVLVDAPAETQAQISFVWLGPPAYSDGYVPFEVAEHELFLALQTKLRREKQLTYGLANRISLGRGVRPLEIRGAFDRTRVGEAVTDTLAVLTRAAATPMDPVHFAEVKLGADSSVGSLERIDGLSGFLARMFIYQRPLDWFDVDHRLLAKTTPEDVRAATARFFPVDRLRVFVVGNVAELRPQLEPLGKVVVRPRVTLP